MERRMSKEEILEIANIEGARFVDVFKRSFNTKVSRKNELKAIYNAIKAYGLNEEELINNFFFPKATVLCSYFDFYDKVKIFNDYVSFIDDLGVFKYGLIIPDKITKIIFNPLRSVYNYNNTMDDNTWFITIRHQKSVKNIFLGNGVKTINPYAFKNCVELENVYISRSVRKIDREVFYNVPNLRNIYIFKGVKEISPYAFNFHMSYERPYRTYYLFYEGSREDFRNIKGGNLLMERSFINLTFNVKPEDAKDLKVLVEGKDLIEENTIHIVNTNWDEYFDNEPDGEYAQSISEGLIKSIRKYAKVDIDYISSICRCEPNEVISKLGKSIYLDPESFNGNYYEGWKTSDEYLSGNIFKKLTVATKFNELYHGLFERNVESLKELLPSGIDNANIYYQISSPWLPKNIVKEYIMDLLGVSSPIYNEYVVFDYKTYLWKISTTIRRYMKNLVNEFSTSRMSVVDILVKVLNLSDIKVYDSYTVFDDVKGKRVSKTKLNYKETMLAEEKGKLLEANFHNWCEARDNIKSEINKKYNELFGYTVNRKFDGSFLDLSDMNPNCHLEEHQINAVARILLTPNTLLAHDVGTGKTYVMASAVMQLRKTNVSKKNLIVVPNSIISQWEGIFKELYPNAKLYVVTPKLFTKKNRNIVLSNIINNDYDAIIMGFSSFDLIPPYRDQERRDLKEELEKLESQGWLSNSALAKIEKIKIRLEMLDDDDLYEDIISYQDLGIERLFVDEAHNYKNIPLDISVQYLRGINAHGSKKCEDFLAKVDMTTAKENGGVIMATGTPITNSISDCYVFQRFLQNGELKLVDIHSFNEWVGTFTEKETDIEIDFDSTNYRAVTRLSKFHNLPELACLLANIADFYDNADEKDLPQNDGYIDVVLENSDDLRGFLAKLTERIDNVRNKRTKKVDELKKDNMLMIISDGRKASIDLRLVDRKKYPIPLNNKIDALCKNVADIYEKTSDNKSTQLIFLDLSVFKSDFNLYSLIKNELTYKYHIKEDEIRFVHEATTEKDRDSIFKKVNNGDVRILLGSTQKLGTGVNVQKRLIAIHHVDVPWRPADMVQRNGRIVRQGNTNKSVSIYRYIKEGSFDAYSWQTLEIKQAFINDLLSNSLDERTKEDISNEILDYAEAKALAMGNSKLKDVIVLRNKINKLSIINLKTKENYRLMKKELLEIPSKIESTKEEISVLEKDIVLYNDNNIKQETKERNELRDLIDRTLNLNIDSEEEVFITKYKGFDMYVPKGMHVEKRFVMLRGVGTYFVEIKTKAGCLESIDNHLEGNTIALELKQDDIRKLEEKSIQIKELLDNKKLYDDEIVELKKELEILEKEIKIING